MGTANANSWQLQGKSSSSVCLAYEAANPVVLRAVSMPVASTAQVLTQHSDGSQEQAALAPGGEGRPQSPKTRGRSRAGRRLLAELRPLAAATLAAG